jgi:hypothetical protein
MTPDEGSKFERKQTLRQFRNFVILVVVSLGVFVLILEAINHLWAR